MPSKEDIIKLLKEHGYKAYVADDGILFIECTEEEANSASFFDSIKKKLKEFNWHRSWGYGVHKNKEQ